MGWPTAVCCSSISLGLSVTMGLMRFVNLAHGVFAMAGGYLCVTLMQRWNWPFLATLPVVFVVVGMVGVVLERTLYRRLYGAGPLDQVLFSIGLVFVSVSAATYVWGAASSRSTCRDSSRDRSIRQAST